MVTIFEDDIDFIPDFKKNISLTMSRLPRDWEFFTFGYCWVDCSKYIFLVDVYCRVLNTVCAGGYTLRDSKVVEKLIHESNKYPPHLALSDTIWFNLLRSRRLKAYATQPAPFLVQNRKKFNSDTDIIIN